MSLKNTDVEMKAVKKLNSFLNFSTIYNKIYNDDKLKIATKKSFLEKGYTVKMGSLTIYGNKPLYEGYLNFLDKVILPILEDFPSQEEFEAELEKGLGKVGTNLR